MSADNRTNEQLLGAARIAGEDALAVRVERHGEGPERLNDELQVMPGGIEGI
jgi:hypothetical protein